MANAFKWAQQRARAAMERAQRENSGGQLVHVIPKRLTDARHTVEDRRLARELGIDPKELMEVQK